MTLSNDDRKFIGELFRNLGEGPLEPNDPRYEPLYARYELGAEDPVEQLARGIDWRGTRSSQLFVGGPGTGKSTELRRLRDQLRRRSYRVVLVDMAEHLDPTVPIDVGEFLMFVAAAVGDALVRDGVLTEEDFTNDLWGRLALEPALGSYPSRLRVAMSEDEPRQKTLRELGNELKRAVREGGAARAKLRAHLAGDVPTLLRDVQLQLADCVTKVRAHHGPDVGFVLLIDSVDHLRGGPTSAEDVQASVEALFVEHAAPLRLPDLHVVYSVPSWLQLHRARLGELYDAVVTLPSFKVMVRSGERPFEPGLVSLRALVSRRGHWRRLLPHPSALDRLLLASGGNLRDVMWLLRDVLLGVDGLPTSPQAIDSALSRARSVMRPPSTVHLALLTGIYQTKRLSWGDPREATELARLIDARLVLEYRNGEAWYDVHPLIVEDVKEHMGDLVARALAAEQTSPAVVRRAARRTTEPGDLAIGLRTLRLANVRLFGDRTLDFTCDGAPRPFTLIVAENGHGKTTVLQAIALAASGVAGANLLAENAAAFFDRRRLTTSTPDGAAKVECLIEATFQVRGRLRAEASGSAPETSLLRAHLSAPASWKEFRGGSESDGDSSERPPPLDAVRAQDQPRWFVAGYGMGRTLPRSRSAREPGRRAVDRLRSLFDAEPPLATGFAEVLADLLGRDVARDYAEVLRRVLAGDDETPGLIPAEAAIRVEGVELRGSDVVRDSVDLADADRFVLRLGEQQLKLPAAWLSAGYQSTIAWVADLLGQFALEAGRLLQPREMAGIVLIDEIDLHLHPRWQATLIPSLRKTFPHVQFIATTHSPMVLPGLRQDEIMMLSLDETGHLKNDPAPVAPALKTGSEIYEHFFGIDKLYPSELGSSLQEYSFLASNPDRSDGEDARMRVLQKVLQDARVDPGWEPEPRTLSEPNA